MQKAVVLATFLLSASMAMAEGIAPPPSQAAALKQLQTVAPSTVKIPGMDVKPKSFAQVLGAIAATIVLGGDAGSTNVLNPG